MGLTFPYFLSLLGSRLPRVVVLSGLQATPNHTATHSRRGEGEARRRGGQGTPLSSPRSHKSDGRSVLVGIPCHFVDRPRMVIFFRVWIRRFTRLFRWIGLWLRTVARGDTLICRDLAARPLLHLMTPEISSESVPRICSAGDDLD